MRITDIQVRHFQSVRHAELKLQTPLTLVTGENMAGKSSLREAIAAAITGEVSRVDLKKNYPQVVTRGESKSSIDVTFDAGAFSLWLPAGTHTAAADSPYLPFAVNTHLFASLDLNERRRLMFKLTNSGSSPAEIVKRLGERGADTKKVAVLGTVLPQGFDAAAKAAKERTAEAKADWKAITGEPYGTSKGESWSAPLPDNLPSLGDIQSAAAKVEKLSTDLNADNQLLGRVQEIQRQAQAAQAKIEGLKNQSGLLARHEKKLETDEAEVAKWESAVQEAEAKASGIPAPKLLPCPCCSASLYVDRNGALAEWEGGNDEPDAQAIIDLPQFRKSRDLLRSSVANDKRDIQSARTAAEQLAQLEKEAIAQPEHDPIAIKSRIADIQAQLRDVKSLLTSMQAQRKQAEDAAANTQKATRLHKDVMEWILIAEALAPDGIPSEILAGAIKPVNDLLMQLSDIAGWPRVSLDHDLHIHSEFLYTLESESSQHRCDILLSLAIAILSGLRFVLIDRFDVLSPTRGRQDLVVLLETLVEEGQLDCAMVFGTLKQAPTGLSELWSAHWIAECGRVSNVVEEVDS